MRTISAAAVTDAVAKLCIQANTHLPPDIVSALDRTRREEPWPLAKETLGLLWDNLELAEREELPVCQDTGMACVFVELGQEVHIQGDFEQAVHEGVRRGYGEGYLRKSIVGDPLRRVNTGDNTPAAITLRLVPGDACKITVAPKGFGSENMSRLGMLKPADGVEGVKRFVVETVRLAGSNPCPPTVLGVGIGGSFDKAAYLAKHALLRPIDQRNPDPFYAALETEMLGEINARTAKNERVLVTTLTKKMAEDLTDFLTEQGIKVKYMHHEVDTFERMEIIKDLRLGSIDVVVGINLLREGLDLPEVSLVAILDADKEGFLRSETSLIQTIGRAARNAEGLVIMYADEVTDSMERAITETERRRAIQMAYNKEHGIVPKTIVKAIADSIEISDKAENAKRNTRRMGKMEREAAIERLTREMKEAAKLLEFEHAAFLRDQIDRLRRGENPTVDSAAETERKQNHAQTQRKGRKYLGKR